jgi:uncharacterized protein
MKHSRRDTLKLLGAGAAAASVAGAQTLTVADEPTPRYFALRDVRLGPGPFLEAQRLDAAYLLKLEPDRMLHNFRVNAGLEPKAPVYGGWESVEPWIWIRCHGHTLGHYLGAAACMYESTGDARFAERVDYIVSELALCQSKTPGWLSAFPDGIEPLMNSLSAREFPGVPWYTVHKVLAGLRDAHRHRGSAQAFDVWLKFSDWIDSTTRHVSISDFQKMLDREHGGMNEVCADLYALTKEPRHLALANRFCHIALLAPLADNVDALDGLHANTQIPKVIGFERIDAVSRNPRFHRAAEFFWRTVVQQRSFVTGGHGDGEHFFPKYEFVKHLPSGKTMETCCTHNMLRLTRVLSERNFGATYGDYIERALFNGILASQDPDTGMNTYFQSTRPGYVRLYHTPFDSFWCCTGSGLENHARYGEWIYSQSDDALYINQFMASTLSWRERGLTVTQETSFPDSEEVTLRFDCNKPQKLRVFVRHPAWCAQMHTQRNGKDIGISRLANDYYQLPIDRVKRGDTVRLRLPMTVRAETLPNAADHVALMYGAIVLAARLGTEGLESGSQLIVNERESGNMLQADVKIPRWTKPLDQLVANTSRTNPDKLEFRTAGFDGGASVQLVPWFRLTHERYNLYWRT